MKKIIAIIILSLMTCFAFAQTINFNDLTPVDNTLKFLGIPVDGRRSDMITALKMKGFKYNPNTGMLVGEFNGRQSNISIVENNNKVFRVAVFDATPIDEGQLKIRYNNLITQFENSKGKYYSITPNERIPETEDISYEIIVHKKQYQATFFYNPIYNNETAKQKIYNESIEECKKIIEEQEDENKYYPNEDDFQQLVLTRTALKIVGLSNSSVWFTIMEQYGRYRIVIFYDNLNNQANGEDL